jgi:hypothetical protein
MALIKLEVFGIDPVIVVDITNVKIGETEFKRKAQAQNLHWNIPTKSVRIELLLVPYEKLADDSYGEPLQSSEYFRLVPSLMIADNTCIVDMQGNLITNDFYGTDEELEATLLSEVDGMRQGDWFTMVASSQPVIVRQMIVSEINRKFNPPPPPPPVEEPPVEEPPTEEPPIEE